MKPKKIWLTKCTSEEIEFPISPDKLIKVLENIKNNTMNEDIMITSIFDNEDDYYCNTSEILIESKYLESDEQYNERVNTLKEEKKREKHFQALEKNKREKQYNELKKEFEC